MNDCAGKDLGDGRALTPASVSAAVLGLFLTGILTQVYDLLIGIHFSSEHTLALPVMWALLVIGLICLGVRKAGGPRLLSRSEQLCVLYVMLVAAPLMTQGMWHRLVAILATNPRAADFEKLDAMNDRLWPHGPNLLPGALEHDNRGRLETVGGVEWRTVEREAGVEALLPVLHNEGSSGVAALRIEVPVASDSARGIVPGVPYLVSVLMRAPELGPRAVCYGRAYADDSPVHTELFTCSDPPRVTVLHKTGFRRVGAYGATFPHASRRITLEFGLAGAGTVELCDPKLFSVAALENAYKGRRVASAAEVAALPPAERANLLVKPDTLWSWAGLRYGLSAYVPVSDWAPPLLAWTAFVLLVLLATLAVNMIMRRQWLDNERCLMPVTRIPLALIADDDTSARGPPPILRNPLLWAGAAAALAWMLLRAWAANNPRVPDPTIHIRLSDYLSDPGWGAMWSKVRFDVDPIFLSMAVFMELNVLLSLVAGFFLFRSQHAFGQATGLNANPSFPFAQHQATAAYLAYAGVLLFFARKYLWGVLRQAASRTEGAARGETRHYRMAIGLLVLCAFGMAAWARRMDMAAGGMLVFFAFLVTIGFVASRVRTECGAPWGYFSPQNLAIFMGMLGGISAFGPQAILFCTLASFMLGPTVFFLIPGAQMEWLELGHRARVPPGQLVAATLLGVVGGMAVGGWVFLSNAYALGGDTMTYQWAFAPKGWYFFDFNLDLSAATQRYLGHGPAQTGWGLTPSGGAAALAALATVAVSVLRQFFAGFWFHPVGLVLGPTQFLDYIWGSALTAWAIRTLVLKLGGAAAVKNRLQPFFVGVFLGAASGYFLLGIIKAVAMACGLSWNAPTLTPP